MSVISAGCDHWHLGPATPWPDKWQSSDHQKENDKKMKLFEEWQVNGLWRPDKVMIKITKYDFVICCEQIKKKKDKK